MANTTKQTREEKRKADLKAWEATKYYNIKSLKKGGNKGNSKSKSDSKEDDKE